MAEQLKNLYAEEFVNRLAAGLNQVAPDFDSAGFIASIIDKNWKNKELKERGNHIAEMMHSHLPYAYKKQVELISRVAPGFRGYTGTIFPTFIEKFGLHDYPTSIQALEEFTTYSTGEFAIRPFLLNYPETIEQLYKWTTHKNHHVRRLASEGSRPLLPWAIKLTNFVEDPGPIIPILEALRNDPEDYVYRSVANNLNDISKNQPDLVLGLCEKWIDESKTTRWVAKHALRTLLKKGDQRAMQLFGFGPIKSIKIADFRLESGQIKIGEGTHFSLSIQNQGKKGLFRLEYVIGYLRKNGKHNEKVFQLRETQLDRNQHFEVLKPVQFKELSTRKHYPGDHYIELKINGIKVDRIDFELL